MSAITNKLDKYVRRYLDTRLVFIMDVLLSLFATVFVAVVAFFLEYPPINDRFFILVLGVSSVISSGLFFYVLRTYTLIIRHFTFKDTSLYFLASLGKVFVMFAALSIAGYFDSHMLVFLTLDMMVSLLLFCMVRVLMITVFEVYKKNLRLAQNYTRVLVYGISEKSMATLTRLRNSRHYQVLGFISSERRLKDKRFADNKVFFFRDEDDFEKIAKDLSLGGILFATEIDAREEQLRLVKYCSDLSMKVLIVPAIDEMEKDRSHLVVRPVEIEDLLGRPEIKISLDDISSNMRDKIVMVTGAAGSIGSELCRQIAQFGIRKLVLFDNAETPMHNLRLELEAKFPGLDFVPIIGDVRAIQRLDFAFRTQRPQIVFHAAAYKHVPLMEENPCEAVMVNVGGSRNVADKCVAYGVEKMVMISTDKAVNPTNIMGCTKRLAEIYVQSLANAISNGKVEGKTKFVTTRFGNVLGSNGSVIPHFRAQIAAGGPVTVTHPDITRFFMTIPEACRLVMEAATLPVENKICVFDMGEPVKIDTLARRMIELSGFEPDRDIKIVYSGLRPGEKLYEEVLSNVENTEPTSHEKIRIADVRLYDYSDALGNIQKLEQLGGEVNIPEMVKLMKEIVPEYISKNSVFEQYDSK